MPTIPTNTTCLQLGCKDIRAKRSNYCSKHTLTKTDTVERKEFNGMYQTNQWRTMRTIQLSKEPLCAGCLTRGRVTNAEHVDHVFPWSTIGKQAFTRNLFQSLCHECHSYKTGQEKQGIIIHYDNQTEKRYTMFEYQSVVSTHYRARC